jgi:hypothetical protein
MLANQLLTGPPAFRYVQIGDIRLRICNLSNSWAGDGPNFDGCPPTEILGTG